MSKQESEFALSFLETTQVVFTIAKQDKTVSVGELAQLVRNNLRGDSTWSNSFKKSGSTLLFQNQPVPFATIQDLLTDPETRRRIVEKASQLSLSLFKFLETYDSGRVSSATASVIGDRGTTLEQVQSKLEQIEQIQRIQGYRPTSIKPETKSFPAQLWEAGTSLLSPFSSSSSPQGTIRSKYNPDFPEGLDFSSSDDEASESGKRSPPLNSIGDESDSDEDITDSNFTPDSSDVDED
jgi:hypothetical protein